MDGNYWGGELNMTKIYGKWEGIEEIIKPNIVIRSTRLRGYILAPGRLKKKKVTLRRKLTVQIRALAYLMVNDNGVGFGSVLWGQSRMIS